MLSQPPIEGIKVSLEVAARSKAVKKTELPNQLVNWAIEDIDLFSLPRYVIHYAVVDLVDKTRYGARPIVSRQHPIV